jgi:hypothetical protein
MSYLSLTLPSGQTINAPASLPSGGLDTTKGVINNALTLMLIFAVIITLIFLIWAGIQWVSSGGDKTKLGAARARLTWAIIGLVIVLISFFIVNVLGSLFNVQHLG